MSLLSRTSPKILALQVLTVLLFLLPFAGVGVFVWQQHLKAERLVADIEPRHARLQGILAKQEDFVVATKLAQGLTNAFVFPAAMEPTQALNESQQKLKAAFTESGFNVEGITVKEASDAGDIQRLKMVIRFDGNLANLQQAVLKLRDITPTMLVETVNIVNQGQFKPATIPRLVGSMEVVILRAKK
jgi:general secretion pathway protein M